jgi:predicted outer membrane repeat protein
VHVQAQSGSTKPVSLKVASQTEVSALTKAASRPNAVIEAMWQGTVKLTKPIIVGESTTLTIVGENVATAIADGGGKTQLFDVGGRANLVLVNMTLTNGFSDSVNGSAVSLGEFASLDAIGSVFSKNTVTGKEGFGGGVYGRLNCTISINTSTFKMNTASNVGGAIATLAGVVISNSVFDSNAACVDPTREEEHCGGGAVAYTANANISDSTFRNNIISGFAKGGGALLDLAVLGVDPIGTADNVTVIVGVTIIERSKFVENLSSSFAGAAYLKGNVTLKLCDFQGNSAMDSGAVSFDGEHITINQCTFADNAAGVAGAVYISAGSQVVPHTIEASNFVNNSCENDGGALYIVIGAAAVEIRSSNFSTNSAGNNGGAVWITASRSALYGVKIEDCVFFSNQAKLGGAIASDHIMSLTSVVLASNEASAGGAIYAKYIVTLTNSTLINNKASLQGNT